MKSEQNKLTYTLCALKGQQFSRNNNIHQKIKILRIPSIDTKFLLFNHFVTKAAKIRK